MNCVTNLRYLKKKSRDFLYYIDVIKYWRARWLKRQGYGLKLDGPKLMIFLHSYFMCELALGLTRSPVKLMFNGDLSKVKIERGTLPLPRAVAANMWTHCNHIPVGIHDL